MKPDILETCVKINGVSYNVEFVVIRKGKSYAYYERDIQGDNSEPHLTDSVWVLESMDLRDQPQIEILGISSHCTGGPTPVFLAAIEAAVNDEVCSDPTDELYFDVTEVDL